MLIKKQIQTSKSSHQKNISKISKLSSDNKIMPTISTSISQQDHSPKSKPQIINLDFGTTSIISCNDESLVMSGLISLSESKCSMQDNKDTPNNQCEKSNFYKQELALQTNIIHTNTESNSKGYKKKMVANKTKFGKKNKEIIEEGEESHISSHRKGSNTTTLQLDQVEESYNNYINKYEKGVNDLLLIKDGVINGDIENGKNLWNILNSFEENEDLKLEDGSTKNNIEKPFGSEKPQQDFFNEFSIHNPSFFHDGEKIEEKENNEENRDKVEESLNINNVSNGTSNNCVRKKLEFNEDSPQKNVNGKEIFHLLNKLQENLKSKEANSVSIETIDCKENNLNYNNSLQFPTFAGKEIFDINTDYNVESASVSTLGNRFDTGKNGESIYDSFSSTKRKKQIYNYNKKSNNRSIQRDNIINPSKSLTTMRNSRINISPKRASKKNSPSKTTRIPESPKIINK